VRISNVVCSFSVLVSMIVSSSSFAAGESPRSELAILPIQADLPKAKVEVLADAIAAALVDLLKTEVLGPAEVRELLSAAQLKVASTCDNVFCLTKLGKDLKVDWLLAAKATAASGKVLLSLKVVDVAGAQVAVRQQDAIGDDVLTYGADVRAVLGTLRAKLPTALQSSTPAPKPATAPAAKAEPDKSAPPKPEPAKVDAASKPAAPAPTSDKPGWIGMGHQDLDADTANYLGLKSAAGSIVKKVAEGGPAALAGLKVGVVILKVDGNSIASAAELSAALNKKKAGATVELVIWSGGKESTAVVTLKEAPAKADRK